MLVNARHGFYVGAMQADSAPPSQLSQKPAPLWAAQMRRANNWLLYDLGGGPRPLKFAWLVDAQKALTLPVLALRKRRRRLRMCTSGCMALTGSYGC
jgi:hypothetical protein